MMHRSFSRLLALIAVVAFSCLASPISFAQSNTLLSFVSEPGDYIGQGQTLSFTTVEANAQFGGQVIQVNAYGPESYSLYLLSPVAGQPLMPGIYEVTAASPRPAFSFSGGSRACTGVGRFEIIEAVFDENGQAERFRANFERHCGDLSQPGLYGEVSVIGQPVPRLVVDYQVDDELALSRKKGRVIVTGTIRCSSPTTVHAFGTLLQEIRHFGTISGQYVQSLECSPQLRHWSVEVQPELTPPVPPGLGFKRGDADVGVQLQAWDPEYYSDAVSSGDHPVTLTAGNCQ